MTVAFHRASPDALFSSGLRRLTIVERRNKAAATRLKMKLHNYRRKLRTSAKDNPEIAKRLKEILQVRVRVVGTSVELSRRV